MTEAQARTKWCPFVRALLVTNTRTFRGPVNRVAGRYLREGEAAITHCIASDCMAWRVTVQGGASGYCGLAGAAP